jgi:hypothetical protein
MPLRLLGIAALLALLATAARADWEGDVEMKSELMERRGAAPPTGKVRFKQGKLRMDVHMGPMEMTSIVDLPARKLFLVNHQAKTFSEMAADHGGAGAGPNDALPRCKSMKFVECMKEQGFKKTGAETVNGQASTIWEGERKMAGSARHEKIWHPDAAGDEFAFVRVETGGEDQGPRNQINILNWKKTPQESAQFQVPDGYEKSEGFPGMMGPPGMRDPRRRPVAPGGAKEKDGE